MTEVAHGDERMRKLFAPPTAEQIAASNRRVQAAIENAIYRGAGTPDEIAGLVEELQKAGDITRQEFLNALDILFPDDLN